MDNPFYKAPSPLFFDAILRRITYPLLIPPFVPCVLRCAT